MGREVWSARYRNCRTLLPGARDDHGLDYGRFVLKPKPGPKPSLQARLVAVTLADQAGRALAASQGARN